MANNNKKPKAQWTVMIYMAADDSASNDASNEFLSELNNLGDILDNQPYKSINILLQVYKDWNVEESQPSNFRARRYKIRPNFLENISHPEIELSSDMRRKDIYYCYGVTVQGRVCLRQRYAKRILK